METTVEWAWQQSVGNVSSRIVLLYSASHSKDGKIRLGRPLFESCQMNLGQWIEAMQDLRDRGLVIPEGNCSDEHYDDLFEDYILNSPAQESTDWLSIYKEYPRKVGRPSAKKAILKALKTVPHEFLLEATKAYAENCKASQAEITFIPHPATWFNDERYNDPLVDPMIRNPKLRTARIATLSNIVQFSPAFPGGQKWNSVPTPSDRQAYQDAVSELNRLDPNFNYGKLRQR